MAAPCKGPEADYADRMRAKLMKTSKVGEQMDPRACDLTTFLLRERRNVLFVGEGNFTFAVAFAALREYVRVPLWGMSDHYFVWRGIVSTRYEPIFYLSNGYFISYPPPNFWEVKAMCVSETLKGFNDMERRQYLRTDRLKCHITPMISMIEQLFPPMDWHMGIDACNLPQDFIPPQGIIWFQCPWSDWQRVGFLVEDFLLNTAKRIQDGSYVCIGVLLSERYLPNYSLERILGKDFACQDNSTEVLKRYTYLGADDTLIKQVLSFGYHHQGRKNIHRYIFKCHVTLVFRKKGDPLPHALISQVPLANHQGSRLNLAAPRMPLLYPILPTLHFHTAPGQQYPWMFGPAAAVQSQHNFPHFFGPVFQTSYSLPATIPPPTAATHKHQHLSKSTPVSGSIPTGQTPHKDTDSVASLSELFSNRFTI